MIDDTLAHVRGMKTSGLAVFLSVSAVDAFVPAAPSASQALRTSSAKDIAVGRQRQLTTAAAATRNMMAAHRAQLKNPGGWVLAGCGVCVGFGYLASSLRSRSRAIGSAANGSDFPDVVETGPPHPEWKPPQKQPAPEGSEKGVV